MAGVLSDLSQTLAGIVEQAGPYVVRVEGRRRHPASGVVWSADGVIVTAHHAVERDNTIHVGLPDKGTVSATLAGRDPTTDLAVLHADAAGLTPAPWGGLGDLRVGHLVVALGRPGRTVQAALGMVGAYGGEWRTPAGGQLDRYLRTDVGMIPGFSGGPLVDAAGCVLGLNTSALLRHFSMAVPASSVRQVVETLLDHGRVRRGYLGVQLMPVHLPPDLGQELEQETGLLVLSAEPGSPAGEAGAVLGDTIVRVDDQPVRHMEELLALLSGDRIGTAVSLGVVRAGQVQELSVVLGERP